MFEKQSIGGAAKQENQQVDRASGEIALDVERLSVQMSVRKPSNQTLPFESVSANGKVMSIRFRTGVRALKSKEIKIRWA